MTIRDTDRVMTAFVPTQNMSILVVILYVWRISVNVRKYGDLEDVYYGVQIAYMAIIGMQVSMVALSGVLIVGINRVRQNNGIKVAWRICSSLAGRRCIVQ